MLNFKEVERCNLPMFPEEECCILVKSGSTNHNLLCITFISVCVSVCMHVSIFLHSVNECFNGRNYPYLYLSFKTCDVIYKDSIGIFHTEVLTLPQMYYIIILNSFPFSWNLLTFPNPQQFNYSSF